MILQFRRSSSESCWFFPRSFSSHPNTTTVFPSPCRFSQKSSGLEIRKQTHSAGSCSVKTPPPCSIQIWWVCINSTSHWGRLVLHQTHRYSSQKWRALGPLWSESWENRVRRISSPPHSEAWVTPHLWKVTDHDLEKEFEVWFLELDLGYIECQFNDGRQVYIHFMPQFFIYTMKERTCLYHMMVLKFTERSLPVSSLLAGSSSGGPEQWCRSPLHTLIYCYLNFPTNLKCKTWDSHILKENTGKCFFSLEPWIFEHLPYANSE